MGISHGDASAPSSAKREELEVAAGVTCSPKSDFEFKDEVNGGVSVGSSPNKDIVGMCRIQEMNTRIVKESCIWQNNKVAHMHRMSLSLQH